MKFKKKHAVALRYDPEHNNAPVVVAKGKGLVAEKIIEKAKESNVPIYHDEGLAESLYALKLDNEIPPHLYGIVAEILAFVIDLYQKYGERQYEKLK